MKIILVNPANCREVILVIKYFGEVFFQRKELKPNIELAIRFKCRPEIVNKCNVPVFKNNILSGSVLLGCSPKSKAKSMDFFLAVMY